MPRFRRIKNSTPRASAGDDTLRPVGAPIDATTASRDDSNVLPRDTSGTSNPYPDFSGSASHLSTPGTAQLVVTGAPAAVTSRDDVSRLPSGYLPATNIPALSSATAGPVVIAAVDVRALVNVTTSIDATDPVNVTIPGTTHRSTIAAVFPGRHRAAAAGHAVRVSMYTAAAIGTAVSSPAVAQGTFNPTMAADGRSDHYSILRDQVKFTAKILSAVGDVAPAPGLKTAADILNEIISAAVVSDAAVKQTTSPLMIACSWSGPIRMSVWSWFALLPTLSNNWQPRWGQKMKRQLVRTARLLLLHHSGSASHHFTGMSRLSLA